MSSQGLQQVQRQVQTQVLAPQLRQSLKILQVSALELRNAIQEELETNPTLEEISNEKISIEEQSEVKVNAEEAESLPAEKNQDKEELKFEDDFSRFNDMDESYRWEMSEASGNYNYSDEDAERRQHFFDSVQSQTSFQEELLEQARMTEASETVITAFEYLIGMLDDRGFLNSSLSDVALEAGLPLVDMQAAHELLLSLDPAGIGARDLSECLLIQLQRNAVGNTIAHTIVEKHFNLLLRRRIPEIARRLGITTEEVQLALEHISQLDPAPGRQFSEDTNRIVVPDIRVQKEDTGEWSIFLNDDFIPRLKISDDYKQLISEGQLEKRAKEYIQDKIRSSRFLISSIEQRQQTLERIARELLIFQMEFFEHGVSGLKPLTMSQIADIIGVHETTISRAIANKYIDTPHGVFDLKYFFTTGYQGNDGSSVSNTSVKERIVKIIDSENLAKPYSDQKIVDMLKAEGVKIARRTVAKYREELGILPTNLRRQYS